MTNWASEEELSRDKAVSAILLHVICGAYFWEYLISLNFEWSLLSGQKRFRWPMLVYFAARYLALFTLIAGIMSQTVNTEDNCAALYKFIAFGGQSIIGLTSAILTIRAIAIWGLRLYIALPLGVLMVGQWVLLMQSLSINVSWDATSRCIATTAKPDILEASFIYAIGFDSIVFLLSAWKLLVPNDQRTPLRDLLFKDGLVYIIIVLLVNIPAAVLLSLKLNPVMNTLPTLPAAIISSIVACRAVRRLYDFNFSGSTSILGIVSHNNQNGRHTRYWHNGPSQASVDAQDRARPAALRIHTGLL
ncbi:hypothetical protein BXZ70DRAFT_463387 [Cristinia sonorae]|uniref:Uncharacterized protein n=1 Tax=Cristinia sonorae TaxID=1940300 RepID=A0A8K0UID7_9AGAR|nr:hypothetical protein BXZ70DRAFT_463387 [Cristinia sonorae]